MTYSQARHLLLLPLAAMLPISAAADVLTLQSRVVTATSTERSLQDAPATITVISREELASRPVQDLEDALRGAPGLQFTGIGLGRRGVSIRGMGAEQTLILVNGQRINTAASAIAHADFDLGWVPVEAIERIEVVRGPMSALYGSEALGGVVNVITRTATDHWRGSLAVNGGVPDHGQGGQTHQLGVYAGGPLIENVLGLSFTGESRKRQATTDRDDPALSELEGRESQSGRVTLHWTPDAAQQVDLMLASGREDRWRNTSSPAGPNSRVEYESQDDIERDQWSLSHTGNWSWGKTTVRAYGNTLNRGSSDSRPTSSKSWQKMSDDIADATVSLPLAGNHLLSLGGEWRRERLEDDSLASGKGKATHRAVFLQDEIQLHEDWSLLLGSRFDQHEEYGWQKSPRAYLVYSHSDSLTIKGGGGRGFKAPTLKQLSPGYSAIGGGGQFTIRGNPDLSPELNTTYELAADYVGDGWSASAGIFQNNLKGLIQTVCVADCGIRGRELRNYENVDRARIRGIELGTELDLPLNLHWGINYTYLDAIDRSADQRLAGRSRHLANTHLKWSPTPGFDAQLRGEYVGSQLGYSRNVAYGLPAYSLWHLELSQQLTPDLTLRGGIENLSDERLADDNVLFNYPEPGRTYHVGLSMSF
ncbi:TonB-dependent receptor domain-containing protein [Halopseudomonas bauzanensis]|uniref:Outer membrane receptor for ferrienterochelin and colicins n=1 Tax=Halopseudomonas bauzanensis TaxID=653930 RepID=A0A1I4JXR9_9GAMM|nr:outer membrane receptor for ferrienterochelin and colicins [Halopseudomonas bauzanensis]SFL71302.1 outer membrane receptor for ferrienterochelin and colicins [Halopseudomonas bauzanensis]